MLKATNIFKKFDDIVAIDDISIEINRENIFGILGTNGSGKSTLLKIICGILKPDEGTLTINNENVYENEVLKRNIFYISDEQFFFKNSTPDDMKNFYKSIYKNFDEKRYIDLLNCFNLDKKRKISTFSKGMKKQVSVILGICSNTKYLLCDETFDGVDSVVRRALKSIFVKDMEDRGLTTIIVSHNIRELEDVCGNVSILHKGKVIVSEDIEDLKLNLHKVQIVFNSELDKKVWEKLNVVKHDKRGNINLITIRGNKEDIENYLKSLSPIFFERVSLSLEEIFMVETEEVGYEIKSLIV